MFRKLTLTLLVSLFTITFLLGQDTKPQTADNILKASYKEAKASDKNVFLIFHASWCSWCKRLENAMQSDELKKIFEDNFIITHLDVQERGDKIKELENPGGNEVMKSFGGEKSGLPFYVFLDAAGKKLADSNVMPENQNIGYPGSDEEITAFAKIIKLSAKHLGNENYSTIIAYLKKNAPKPAAANH
ncbi:MAG: thioredoxin family protein [Ignavibacteriales bacterium]|nr:thioredoxin family protein [Ignavibacteriales bacterium]